MLEKKYSVAFYDANGTFLGECTVPHGSTARPSEPPKAPKGWRFDHWEPQVSYVVADTRARAVYCPKEYPVTFVSETGTVLKREYVAHGQDANPPQYISKLKGRPASWSAPTTNIQQPRIFRAVFEVRIA